MAYHDDLLQQALQLVHQEPSNQASLRRSVSTGYYSLFHLLIAEAVANWSRVGLRAALGRAFDHGIMKAASNRTQDTRQFPFTEEDAKVVADLRAVAKTFAQLQEKRHTADYDQYNLLDANGSSRASQIGGTGIQHLENYPRGTDCSRVLGFAVNQAKRLTHPI